MKIYYTLLVIVLVACGFPKAGDDDKLIISRTTEDYSFKISEIKTKYNEEGEKQCRNYSSFRVAV